MKFCEGDYEVRMVKFPGSINAIVHLSDDGSGFPIVYVNDQLSPEARKRAVNHELQHLERDDFYNDLAIEEVEADDLQRL